MVGNQYQSMYVQQLGLLLDNQYVLKCKDDQFHSITDWEEFSIVTHLSSYL